LTSCALRIQTPELPNNEFQDDYLIDIKFLIYKHELVNIDFAKNCNLIELRQELEASFLEEFDEFNEDYVLMTEDQSGKLVQIQNDDESMVLDRCPSLIVHVFPNQIDLFFTLNAKEEIVSINSNAQLPDLDKFAKEVLEGAEVEGKFSLIYVPASKSESRTIDSFDNNNIEANRFIVDCFPELRFSIVLKTESDLIKSSNEIAINCFVISTKTGFAINCNRTETIQVLRQKIAEQLEVNIGCIQLARKSEDYRNKFSNDFNKYAEMPVILGCSLDDTNISNIFKWDADVVYIIIHETETMIRTSTNPSLPFRNPEDEKDLLYLWMPLEQPHLIHFYKTQVLEDVIKEIAWNHKVLHHIDLMCFKNATLQAQSTWKKNLVLTPKDILIIKVKTNKS